MTVLVIDVAAEHSGALTILNQFISEFEHDENNNYYIALSTLDYEDTKNITFLQFPWVKKTHLHRLVFDKFYVPKLVERYHPDVLLSLQNNAFPVNDLKQEVYFHNALPIAEKRFAFTESKNLWIYQNIIGTIVRHSLKYADSIIVQANWIKKTLETKWGINNSKIIVKKPTVVYPEVIRSYHPVALFYPANGSIYKNHITLIKALIPIWEQFGAPELRLTGAQEELPEECQNLLKKNEYPITFLGRLTNDEMIEQYLSTLLVFPSYIETVGLPLIEAKALGCKIIVSDCDYAHEALENYNDVIFFPCFNIDSLRSAIVSSCRAVEIIKQER